MAQLGLFEIAASPHWYDVAITPEIERALADDARLQLAYPAQGFECRRDSHVRIPRRLRP